TYVNSPKALDASLRLTGAPTVRLAGQITGVEGYVESAACGFMAGVFTAWDILGKPTDPPGRETAMGALLAHLSASVDEASVKETRFQPSNINFALFPPLGPGKVKKKERRRLMILRAREEMRKWLIRHGLFSGQAVP
ncbi:MAG: FAD-dependent oxidoreductase, partial [Nitrospinota bacterium]|nr:FAD-dependent oxidoreductase [Nitrospinota bacterium]